MAQQQQQAENPPAQNLPLKTLGEVVPAGYNMPLGKTNLHVDFIKL